MADLWRLSFSVAAEHHAIFADALEDVATSLATYRSDSSASWSTEALFDDEASAGAARNQLRLLATELRTAHFEIRLERLRGRDWLAENRRSFPPVRAGRFFIRGSHVGGPPPPSAVPILLDASMAFGTGEHATTKGCLLAFDRLARRRRIRRALDLGTGSGILAISTAKALRIHVRAVDIDHQSVRLTRENVRRNGVAALITAGVSAGFARLPGGERYDLIFANILARPLITLAPDIARHLSPGGRAILSGLLCDQAAAVINAYRNKGLRLERRIQIDGWLTLVMGKL